MELYLFKSTLCLAIFIVFYKAFLEKENMHTLKRFYLLGAVLVSFITPLLSFTKYIESTGIHNITISPGTITVVTSEITTQTNYVPMILWSIYGLGVLFFSIKFIKNLSNLIQKIQNNPQVKGRNVLHVLLNNPTTPHTFFRYIFLNKQKFEANEIPQEVLLHEQIHANQRHSIDTLFIELIQIIFWFNPLLYFLKKSIKLNHEFLADQGVLQLGTDPYTYQNLLLAFSSNASSPTLANSINYSFIKKRFTVMKTQTSSKAKWLKSLFIIPLLSVILYGFSDRTLVVKPNATAEEIVSLQEKKATPEELKEYNRLAKIYNAQPIESRVVKLKDLKRLEYLYKRMSQDQKEQSAPFPECIPPPPPAKNSSLDHSKIPPPPPPAIPSYSLEPIDQVVALANEHSAFFYEDKPITSDYAIALLKANKNLHVKTTTFKNSNPIVNISAKPFPAEGSLKQLPGVDPFAYLMDLSKKGAVFYMDGKEIPTEKALEIIRKDPNLRIEIDETSKEYPIVTLSGC